MNPNPCLHCKKRWTCFGPCHQFELYITFKNTRLIRISCAPENCKNKKWGLPCLFHNNGTCIIYQYAEWKVV